MTLKTRIDDFLAAAESLAQACDSVKQSSEEAAEAHELFNAQVDAIAPVLTRFASALQEMKASEKFDIAVLDMLSEVGDELSGELDSLIDYAETLADALDNLESEDADTLSAAA
jgi:ABC-type transporter Mla subunit MlaD